MAMNWVRWYHGTATDPKWRLVARKSGQRLTDVIAVWAMVLEAASEASERGTLEGFDPEVAAAALDLDPEAVVAILDAMQGRVLDGNRLKEHRWRIALRRDDGRPPAHEWAVLREAVFARDDWTCAYCGERGGRLECDHVIPVSRGGSNDLDNLVAACVRCNRSKRDKTPDEWKGAEA